MDRRVYQANYNIPRFSMSSQGLLGLPILAINTISQDLDIYKTQRGVILYG